MFPNVETDTDRVEVFTDPGPLKGHSFSVQSCPHRSVIENNMETVGTGVGANVWGDL